MIGWKLMAAAVALASLAFASVVVLERARAGLSSETVRLGATPITLWRPAEGQAAPLVVIAHGYAGSRQMMRPLAISLAQAGYIAATFDFLGHGRNAAPMTGDLTSIEGATERLVRQTTDVAEHLAARPEAMGIAALIGHSMATDIVIRAADRLGNVGSVVAISMYSDAVTPTRPKRLLMISGEFEGRLREVALDRLRLVDPSAEEGETVRAGEVERRAIHAPWAGHVGVLYAGATLEAVRDWLAGNAEADPTAAAPPRTGPWILLLLGSVTLLAWPLARLCGPTRPRRPEKTRAPSTAIIAPPGLAFLATTAMPGGLFPLAAFGQLAVFFGVFGAVQLAALLRAGVRPNRFSWRAFALLLLWGLGAFALALDRYGAAFVPAGPRLPVALGLLIGTTLFCLADAMLAGATGWPRRLVSRVLALASLLGSVLVAPALASAFTVVPVLVLFWLVYGSAASAFARRVGPAAPGLALGIILAWAIAASTPLVAA